MNKFEFYCNCVNWDSSDLESLESMVDESEEITYSEMIEQVSLEQLSEEFPMYDNCPLTLERDWHVRYHKSTLHGKECYFVVHSAIEYVYIPS